MWEDYITSMPAIFTCGSFDSVFLVQNPISFKASLGLCHCPWLIMLGL